MVKVSSSFRKSSSLSDNGFEGLLKQARIKRLPDSEAPAIHHSGLHKTHRHSASYVNLADYVPRSIETTTIRENTSPHVVHTIRDARANTINLQRSVHDISYKKLGNCMINNLYFIPKSRRSSHGVQSMTKLKTEVNFATIGARASKPAVPSYLVAKFSPQTKVQFTPTLKKSKSRR